MTVKIKSDLDSPWRSIRSVLISLSFAGICGANLSQIMIERALSTVRNLLLWLHRSRISMRRLETSAKRRCG